MEKKLNKNLRILIILNSSLILFAIIYTLIIKLNKEIIMPDVCFFQKKFHLYCPGCGGSRSLEKFITFHFLKSFILYPPIIVSAFVVLDYDRRLISTLIYKNTDKTDNFKFKSFILIPISIILTFIIRNILLFFFEIDTVGDFF